ncbi:MAG: SGNH/GDSL hydrolase family protein [Planctomycetaceae bacterium]
MTNSIRAAGILLTVLLAGVGTADLFAFRAPGAANGRPLRIVAFGDSTTATRRTVNAVYAARLPKLLKKRGVTATVVNAGVGGSHTGRLKDNARHKVRHALDRLDAAVRKQKPDVVVVQFGINDSWVDSGKRGGKSRIPLADYRKNLTRIVRTLKKDGVRVILMTPNKIGGKHPAWRVALLSRYADAARNTARREGVELVDVWMAFERYEKSSGKDRATLMLDGVHPNDSGHALVAKLLSELIAQPKRRPR